MSATIPTSATVPLDLSIGTWRRFINKFEPDEFSGWTDECNSWKTSCYIGNWSQLLKLRLTGLEAKTFFEYISVSHWPKFSIGQAKHAIFCEDGGHIMGEGLILRVGEDDYIFTSVPGVAWATFQFLRGQRSFNASLEDVTDQWYLFQVQGPTSIGLVEEVTGSSLRDLPFMRAKQLSIGNYNFWCLRQGVSGEVGFELWGDAKDGPAVYAAIRTLGEEKYGLRQLGARAKSVNHVEAGFVTPALEFLPALHRDTQQIKQFLDYLRSSPYSFVESGFSTSKGNFSDHISDHYRTPYDVGWDRLVKFDHDFIGREALEGVARDPPYQLVTLLWNSEDVKDVYASMFTEDPCEFMEIPRQWGLEATKIHYRGNL
ncbi:Hypothetical protein D9617_2g054480 [Elsinoe fawcettii]|nr:Hypothetical protein D9617_2g054480 [Elsinoe fawcettii]